MAATKKPYLRGNHITHDVLAKYPHLLDKYNPDPKQYGVIISFSPVPHHTNYTYQFASARFRSMNEERFARDVLTLTEIRSMYVVLPQ